MGAYQGRVPGACVLVRHEGAAIHRAYGYRDLERGISASRATNYRLASVSKQFTAAALLLLAETGRVSIDDAARRWLPRLPKGAQAVTVRQLLTHTSGLIDFEELIPQGQRAQLHDADVLDLLEAQDRTYFAPGTAYRYSNSGYCLLALIIEAASNLSFAAMLRERIFVPLGMAGTVAHQEGLSMPANRAYGYSFVEGGWLRTDQNLTSATLGDGGIYSSIEDLEKWDAALEDDRLLSNESRRLAFAPATPTDDPKTPYGFGWRITHDTVWHSGESIGFRNVILRYPKRRLTVMILSNRNDREPYPMANAIADLCRGEGS